jgi:hypothetical protein
MDQSMLPFDPHHLEVLSGAPKTISKAIALSVQTVALSYVKISSISKRTEASFQFTHVT